MMKIFKGKEQKIGGEDNPLPHMLPHSPGPPTNQPTNQ